MCCLATKCTHYCAFIYFLVKSVQNVVELCQQKTVVYNIIWLDFSANGHRLGCIPVYMFLETFHRIDFVHVNWHNDIDAVLSGNISPTQCRAT